CPVHIICYYIRPNETAALSCSEDEFVAERHRVMQSRLEPVMTEALEARGRTQEQMDDAYRRIVSAVLLFSGLGSPTNVAVVRETTAALQSIFPQSDILSFLKCGTAQKRNQIEQFTGIVTGIRLFNKECLKGGAGIDDIPQLLVDGIPKTLGTLHDQLLKAREVAARNASLFMKLSAHDSSPGALSSANATILAAEQSGVTPDLLRAVVINARQYEAFLEVLEKELIEMTANADRLCNIFKSQMKQLRELVSDLWKSMYLFLATTDTGALGQLQRRLRELEIGEAAIRMATIDKRSLGCRGTS
ncbi:hypothetical protein X801_04765, partial [Opisthorchis viverrini]